MSSRAFFRGAVFDLDGVVADSEPLHIRSWIEVLGSLGTSRGALTEEVIQGWTGVPDVDIVSDLVRRYELPVDVEGLLEQKRSAYRRLVAAELASFDGVVAELKSWRGFPLGLATATARRETMLMLSVLGLQDTFRAVVTGDDVERAKPAPDCYRQAARLLGLPPERCAAIEDSPHGIKAAREAGLFVVAVATSFKPEVLGEAHRSFTSVIEAISWLKGRAQNLS